MKCYLLSLLCAFPAGLAWAADAPAPVPCASCGPVCVPQPTMRKTDTVIYDDRCVSYCLLRCSLFSVFWGGDCGCGDCGQPRTRHVLIKKVIHVETPAVKCEVRQAP